MHHVQLVSRLVRGAHSPSSTGAVCCDCKVQIIESGDYMQEVVFLTLGCSSPEGGPSEKILAILYVSYWRIFLGLLHQPFPLAILE